MQIAAEMRPTARLGRDIPREDDEEEGGTPT